MPENEEKNDSEEKKEQEPKFKAKQEEKDEQSEQKERFLRLAADFDNYKKRMAKELAASEEKGRAEAISRLLPTLDEFELALASLKPDSADAKGIRLVYSNLLKSLKDMGLHEMPVDGKPDPYRHETIMMQESDKPEGTILEVVRKGYMLNSIMLRPASIIISKGAAKKEGDEENKKEGENV